MARLHELNTVRRTGLLVFLACFWLAGAWAPLSAKKTARVDKRAKATFEARCAGCHGSDGAGTPLGRSLKAADLRSREIQERPDSELIEAVANGKGNMPPFSTKLSAPEIRALIAYVRTLRSVTADNPK